MTRNGSTGRAGAIEALAARQHGVVSRTQLMELGFSSAAVARRVGSGQLRTVHSGVYQVGPLEGPHAVEMAAVLAAGPSALLSHGSALRAWKLGSGPRLPVHVTVPGRRELRRAGIVVHRPRRLDDSERAVLSGVPITSPLRTLVDTASTLGSSELAKALASAERMGLVTPAELASWRSDIGAAGG